MKKNILPLLLLLQSAMVFAQKMPDLGLNRIRISTADKVIQLEVQPVDRLPDTYADRTYYWYSANAVHITQGGFSGKLLNGTYVSYYLNKNLDAQGQFKKGLKEGLWKKWDEQGTLLEMITWQFGLKTGDFSLFDESGRLRQSGRYRQNLLDGEIKYYNGRDSVRIEQYRAGKLVPQSERQSFWQRINLFKKPKTAAARARVTKPAKTAKKDANPIKP